MARSEFILIIFIALETNYFLAEQPYRPTEMENFESSLNKEYRLKRAGSY